jgi:hypothetical protein
MHTHLAYVAKQFVSLLQVKGRVPTIIFALVLQKVRDWSQLQESGLLMQYRTG